MNRSVMKRQMFEKGGVAFPDLSGDGEITQRDILMGRGVQFMQEGGIASMGMDPMAGAPMAGAPMAAGPEQMDPQVLEGAMMTASENFGALDDAQNYEEVIDSIRGDALPIEQRYQELAQFVGPNDAQQTPESVLAMVQPVIQMAAVDGGIGGLASEEMSAEVSGPMAGGIMSTVAMEGGEEPPVNFNQGGDARRNTQDVRYYNYGGQVQPMMDPRGPVGLGTGFSGGFDLGGKSKAQLSLEPFKEYLAEEVQNQAMQDVTGQVDPFIQDVSAQASEKFGLNQGGQDVLGGLNLQPANLMNGTGTQMPISSLNAIPLAPSFDESRLRGGDLVGMMADPFRKQGGQSPYGPQGIDGPQGFYADGGPVQYYQEAGVVTPLEQEMNSRLGLYERMGLGSQAERDASLANQKNLTQAQILFDIAGSAAQFAAAPGGQSLAQILAKTVGDTQLFDKLSARTQSLADFQTAQKKEERGIRLAALTSSETALTARNLAQEKTNIFNLENAADIASATTAYGRSQTTALDLADVKTQSAKELVLAQTALQELKGQQGQAIEQTKAKLREKIIQLEQENIKINKDIDLKNDLNKIGVNHSNDLQTIELNDAYATKLQNSRFANAKETNDLDRALNYSKLNLSSRTEDRLAINQELNQARDDLKMLVTQGNLKLAQDKELRIKDLENSKLLIDQASLSLSVNADERAALDQKFNQAIKEKETLLSQEKFELAKDAELRIKTIDEQRLLLNYKQLDLEGKKVLNKSLNDELNQAREDKKLQLADKKFGLAEQTELRIKTLEDKKLIIDQAELVLKTKDQDFSKILSNKKLALEREKLKLNTLGSSFDAKVIDLISDADLMEEYAAGRLRKGEVIRINNAITSYQIGTPVFDVKLGKDVPNPRQLDADTIEFINRRIKNGGNGPAGFGLDSTGGFNEEEIKNLVGEFSGVDGKPTINRANAEKAYDVLGKQEIKFDGIENIKNATGVWNSLGRLANVATETFFGAQIAPKSAEAIAQLQSLNLLTVLSIQKARQGKNTTFSSGEIYAVLPKVSDTQTGFLTPLLETDGKALNRINSLIPVLENDIANQVKRLNNPENQAEFNEIQENLNVLRSLKNTWQNVADVYSGDFEGTNTEERSTESFLRKD